MSETDLLTVCGSENAYFFQVKFINSFQVMASDRKPFHRSCVKCYSCRIPLNPRTLNEHEEQLYCNVCYEKIFNPADFTVDNYGGIVTPEDIER